MKSLEFSSNNTKITATPTEEGKIFNIITAITDSQITYTEYYESQPSEEHTHELTAGQSIYGIYKTISATGGYVKASR